jgi:peptidyl-prolyl cis-trans isomerase D
MLQRIRDRISGWIAGVIIALVAGAFMLFGVEYYFDQGATDQSEAAKVNGVIITDNQVNTASSQLQQQMQSELHGLPLTSQMVQQLKAYALQTLVMQTALASTLENEKFLLGMTQVKMMVEQTPEFQNNGQFSESKMMAALYQANLSPLEFFKRIQSQWIVTQVTNGVEASAFVLPAEVVCKISNVRSGILLFRCNYFCQK